MISRFGAAYPQIEVKLKLTDHIVNLHTEGVDLAIRMANFEDSSLTLRKIATVRRGLFSSLEYVKAHGMPLAPQDLRKHKCLVLRFPGSSQIRWPFLDGDSYKPYDISGPMHSDDGDVLTDWALAGEGIILKPLFEVAEHLMASRLVPVMPDYLPQDVALGILFPTKKMMPVWMRHLIDLIALEGDDYISTALSSLDAGIPML
jgi:DNA-binding transcriptional LysR family regulator